MKRIALTGATGFIGGRIATQLMASGHQVKALVRSPAKASFLADAGVELVAGGLGDAAALAQLVRDVDTVIHCAGAVRGATLDDFLKTNTEGTQRLLDAVLALPVTPRFLLFSSLAAREPDLSNYSRSKYEGELLLKALPAHVSWSVLRPPAVYGPGDRELLPLFQWMAKGIALVPGRASARVSLIHVDDLVSAVDCWLQTDSGCAGQVYTLCDPRAEGYSWAEMTDEAAAALQRRIRIFTLPQAMLDLVARANSVAARILGYAPMLTPEKLRELRHPDWVCDASAFSEATGWQPQIDFRKGLMETLAKHQSLR